MLAILTLIFVVALSMLVTKIAAIALEHTGMERERARFQARSAFTGAGFTTSESEQVVKHPIRRKIIMTLLLLGNAGVVTAISSLIIGFTAQKDSGHRDEILILIIGILFLYLITRSRKLERVLDRVLTKIITKYSGLRPRSFARLMTVMDDYEVIEVSVEDNSWLCNSTLADLKLTAEGILVLGILSKNDEYDGVPRGSYRVQPEDKLIMYGRGDTIENVSKRRDKLQGKVEHLKSREEFEKETSAEEAD
jgi:K+/H+ antiporter YhaU regulatory subunit KhtT